MGQIANIKNTTIPALGAPQEAELIRVLGNSLYPGAKPESIALVLGYCRAAGLDPMLKPVHIVPMWDSKTRQMRDVIMPGIGHYRVQAARSGMYVGKTEPEFGPDVTGKVGGVEITYPAWCRVTVKRAIGEHVAEFTATERWLENYATAGRDSAAPNAMWKKRPYGQLAKVAEAQALRQAFPELMGGETAEEMEGKEIDVTPTTVDEAPKQTGTKAKPDAKAKLDGFANVKPKQDAVLNHEPKDDQGHIEDAEIVGEDGGKPDGVPAMPEEAAEAWANGKWAKGWQWFRTALPTIDQKHRQLFWNIHRELLDKVRSYNEEAKAAVAALAEEAGVKNE